LVTGIPEKFGGSPSFPEESAETTNHNGGDVGATGDLLIERLMWQDPQSSRARGEWLESEDLTKSAQNGCASFESLDVYEYIFMTK
jgi:hypothetical protein